MTNHTWKRDAAYEKLKAPNVGKLEFLNEGKRAGDVVQKVFIPAIFMCMIFNAYGFGIIFA
jgi:hypothetical protein